MSLSISVNCESRNKFSCLVFAFLNEKTMRLNRQQVWYDEYILAFGIVLVWCVFFLVIGCHCCLFHYTDSFSTLLFECLLVPNITYLKNARNLIPCNCSWCVETSADVMEFLCFKLKKPASIYLAHWVSEKMSSSQMFWRRFESYICTRLQI